MMSTASIRFLPEIRYGGIFEDGVGYLENENFLAYVPEDIQAKLKEIIGKIGSGEIVVPSYYDFDSYEAFATYRDNPNAEFVK